ncbi:hypothetical protein [Streptomyces sp. NRRL S-15]|uniref:hypothetical protein n=1 Tax=Streptomyces sp. NRRL S-15 TaxID=1463886 RepID=UPI0004C69FA1|nr:hypothetical protein [Streptomyces sp. NRRL S-15]
MKKNLLLILAALALLVLFPGAAQAVAAIVSAAVVWLSTQPVLVGFGLGLIALPHLRRNTKTA